MLYFLNEEGKFVEKGVNRMAVNVGQKPPLGLTFCIYLVRKSYLIREKSGNFEK